MCAIRRQRQSAYVLRAGILCFYQTCKLFPRGLTPEMECVQEWGLKLGSALVRFVPGMQSRASTYIPDPHEKAGLRTHHLAAKVGRVRRLWKRAPQSKLKKLNKLRVRIATTLSGSTSSTLSWASSFASLSRSDMKISRISAQLQDLRLFQQEAEKEPMKVSHPEPQSQAKVVPDYAA